MHTLKNRGFQHPVASDITPQSHYLRRRELMLGLAASAAAGAWPSHAQTVRPGKLAALPGARSAVPGAVTMDKVTPYGDASSYDNFYEFGTDKSDPARHAGTLKPRPWASVPRIS